MYFLQEKASIRVLFYVNDILFHKAILPPRDYDVFIHASDHLPSVNLSYAPVSIIQKNYNSIHLFFYIRLLNTTMGQTCKLV